MVAVDVRCGPWKIQDADAGGGGRACLSRAVYAVGGVFQRAAAAECAVEAGDFPRRGALGAEAAEQPVLVQDVFRLAGDLREVAAGFDRLIVGRAKVRLPRVGKQKADPTTARAASH